MQTEITDREKDQLVYELYGLAEEEISIMENGEWRMTGIKFELVN